MVFIVPAPGKETVVMKTTLAEPPITTSHFGVSMITGEITIWPSALSAQYRGMDLKSCTCSRTDSDSIVYGVRYILNLYACYHSNSTGLVLVLQHFPQDRMYCSRSQAAPGSHFEMFCIFVIVEIPEEGPRLCRSCICIICCPPTLWVTGPLWGHKPRRGERDATLSQISHQP